MMGQNFPAPYDGVIRNCVHGMIALCGTNRAMATEPF